MLELLASFRWVDVADLALVWGLVWVSIVSLRATRARMALIGMGMLLGIYLAAESLDLALTTQILRAFLAASVFVVVVVFQEDLRRLFEQIATIGLRRQPVSSVVDGIDTLARSLVRLAERKQGALVVVPGLDPLEPHLDGGVSLDARMSEPLLLSLFDPHSPGHDGAVLLRGERVAQFAIHLPLSSDHRQLGQRGTRHAAGLGLAERCDALCLVVSEERGAISVAVDGQLRQLRAPSDVSDEIRTYLRRLAPAEAGRRAPRMLARWREALLAIPVAAVLWMLAIPGGAIVVVAREFPVTVRGLPKAYALESVEPERVTLQLAGRRRDLYMLDEEDVTVPLDVILVNLGRRSFQLSPAEIAVPPEIEVREVEPETIKISVAGFSNAENGDPTGPENGKAEETN